MAGRTTKRGDRARLRRARHRERAARCDTTPELVAVLQNEHAYTARLLTVLEEQLDPIEPEAAPDYGVMRDVMNYMTRFPDQYHHPKEDLLFARLVAREPGVQEVVDRLVEGHQNLQQLGIELYERLDRVCRGRNAESQKLRGEVRKYISILRQHMAVEEDKVFARSSDLLTRQDWDSVDARMRAIDDPIFGGRVAPEYDELYAYLTERIEQIDMSSWQKSMLNFSLKRWFKPLMQVGRPSVTTMRRFTRSMDRFWSSVPEGADVTPLEGEAFDGCWIDVEGFPARRRVVMYLPGGAYMLRTRAHRPLLARLCRESGARGLMVEYRLAPEHPFPAGLEDCVEAYCFLLDEGWDPSSIVIAGDSSGGGLTLATLLVLRDDGLPLPGGAVIMSALTDLTFQGRSRRENRRADPMLPERGSVDEVQYYLDGTPADHPLVSPCYADFRGLPPILAQVGSTEVLLDDTLRVANRARAQGVDFEAEVWDGSPHVFQLFDFLPESAKAVRRIGRFVREHAMDDRRDR